MKNLFIILLFICAINVSALQAQEMEKGMSLFNVGFGFIPGWGLNASYEYGVIDTWGPGTISIGGYVGYGKWWKRYSISKTKYHINESALTFAPRITYRFSTDPSFEIFGAIMFGAAVFSYSEAFDNTYSSYFATTVGCRYSFSDHFAAFAEIGNTETSNMIVGLCFSF